MARDIVIVGSGASLRGFDWSLVPALARIIAVNGAVEAVPRADAFSRSIRQRVIASGCVFSGRGSSITRQCQMTMAPGVLPVLCIGLAVSRACRGCAASLVMARWVVVMGSARTEAASTPETAPMARWAWPTTGGLSASCCWAWMAGATTGMSRAALRGRWRICRRCLRRHCLNWRRAGYPSSMARRTAR